LVEVSRILVDLANVANRGLARECVNALDKEVKARECNPESRINIRPTDIDQRAAQPQ
jgi:hypothetical protein